MEDKKLKKLGRRELLELLLDMEEKNAALSDELSKVKNQLENREIIMRESGSLAEASMKLNGVFAAADAAVKQYQENIKRCSEQQQQTYARIVSSAKEKAKEIIQEAELEKRALIKEADVYWENLRNKLEDFYEMHQGIRELLFLNAGSEAGGRK